MKYFALIVRHLRYFVVGSVAVAAVLFAISVPMISVMWLHDTGHVLASAIVALSSIIFGSGALYSILKGVNWL